MGSSNSRGDLVCLMLGRWSLLDDKIGCSITHQISHMKYNREREGMRWEIQKYSTNNIVEEGWRYTIFLLTFSNYFAISFSQKWPFVSTAKISAKSCLLKCSYIDTSMFGNTNIKIKTLHGAAPITSIKSISTLLRVDNGLH